MRTSCCINQSLKLTTNYIVNQKELKIGVKELLFKLLILLELCKKNDIGYYYNVGVHREPPFVVARQETTTCRVFFKLDAYI
jgi:hypothetical protein